MPVEAWKLMLRIASAALLALTLGCGGGEPRGDVDGTVTFDGQPVAAGMVSFEPVDATGPARNVPIRDGSYRASGASALAPGAYGVRIFAGDPAAIEQSSAGDQHTPFQHVPLLPPSWNTQSQLSVDVQPGRNTFHFSGKKGEEPCMDAP